MVQPQYTVGWDRIVGALEVAIGFICDECIL